MPNRNLVPPIKRETFWTAIIRDLAALALAVVLAVAGVWWFESSHRSSPKRAAPIAHPPFRPTIPNRRVAPGRAPQGMVWILGSEFSVDVADFSDHDDAGGSQARWAPVHRVQVDGFFAPSLTLVAGSVLISPT